MTFTPSAASPLFFAADGVWIPRTTGPAAWPRWLAEVAGPGEVPAACSASAERTAHDHERGAEDAEAFRRDSGSGTLVSRFLNWLRRCCDGTKRLWKGRRASDENSDSHRLKSLLSFCRTAGNMQFLTGRSRSMALKSSRATCGFGPWHYCLSLSSAVVLYSLVLLVFASWQTWLCLSPALLGSEEGGGGGGPTSLVDSVRSGIPPGTTMLRSPIGDEEAPIAQVDRRERQLVTGWFICLVVCSSLNVITAMLSMIAVLCKLRRLSLFLGWLMLLNVIFCLGVLLMHLFIEEVGAVSRRWKVRRVVAWAYGLHLDLWVNILAGFPLTRVYASLSNIQEAGGTGFEARPIKSLVPPSTAVRLLAIQKASSFMRSLGSWSVALTLARGGLAWAVFCIVAAVFDFGASWLAASMGVHIPHKMDYLLMSQGIFLCITAILGISGIMGSLARVTLGAFLFNVIVCLQAIGVTTWWWMGVSLVPALRGNISIVESQAVIAVQYILGVMLWPSSKVFCSIALKQQLGFTGFESPAAFSTEENEAGVVGGSGEPSSEEVEEHRSLIETGAE